MTIFRGAGGGGNSTTDSEISLLTALSVEAAASAALAGVAASAASVSAANASGSASSIVSSVAIATTQASNASTSASGASTSASSGAASAAAALASQNSAAASQATASTAATTATTQAGLATTNGAAQVALATTQAGNAATSAAASSTSATGSASSASAAFNSAATATTQAGIATTQAGLATTNGAAQVALATTQAGNASTSATGASSSASAASTSASNASTSATNASNSATAAANSAASINDANLVHKTGNETIGGIKTFSATIVGSVSGNAATATNQSGGTVSSTNIAYTGTLIGGTGVVNLGSGQFYKDALGNVGIGTSSPGLNPAANRRYLTITGTGESGNLQFANSISASPNNGNIEWHDVGNTSSTSTRNCFITSGSSGTAANNKGGFIAFGTKSDGVANAADERVRIDPSGTLLVGRSSAYGDGAVGTPSFQVNGVVGSRAAAGFIANTTGSINMLGFINPNGTVGAINVTGSNTSYNTSSDYRLKNTIAPIMGALDRVALLKPVTYKWIADGSDGQGFIAHELAEVEPGCVTGEKDAVDAEGKPQYQGIDTSFLVATLAAAIQELKAIVDEQAAKIAALEAK